MVDPEKVVGHLYDCLAASKPENMWVFVRKDIVRDALDLLKEQKAKLVLNIADSIAWMEAGMADPYRKAWESIGKALSVQSNMILWIAKRTLSAKEFEEFVDEFAKKPEGDHDELLDFILKEGQ